METKARTPSKEETLGWYDEDDRQLVKLILESKNRAVPRVQEIIEFAQHAGYTRLGIANCVGLADSAAVLAEKLSEHFEVTRLDCKVCGLQNCEFLADAEGAACNPVAQAKLLAEAGTELNIVLGLCLGHDLLFQKYTTAPSTTLVVKDRVLGHNPVAALQS